MKEAEAHSSYTTVKWPGLETKLWSETSTSNCFTGIYYPGEEHIKRNSVESALVLFSVKMFSEIMYIFSLVPICKH